MPFELWETNSICAEPSKHSPISVGGNYPSLSSGTRIWFHCQRTVVRSGWEWRPWSYLHIWYYDISLILFLVADWYTRPSFFLLADLIDHNSDGSWMIQAERWLLEYEHHIVPFLCFMLGMWCHLLQSSLIRPEKNGGRWRRNQIQGTSSVGRYTAHGLRCLRVIAVHRRGKSLEINIMQSMRRQLSQLNP